jgi:hypothetical protein
MSVAPPIIGFVAARKPRPYGPRQQYVRSASGKLVSLGGASKKTKRTRSLWGRLVKTWRGAN